MPHKLIGRVEIISGYIREGEFGEIYRYHTGLDMYFVRFDSDGREMAFSRDNLSTVS